MNQPHQLKTQRIPYKRRKKIAKPLKVTKPNKKVLSLGSYAPHASQHNLDKKHIAILASMPYTEIQQSNPWKAFLQLNHSIIQQSISSVLKQFPTLTSVDELFSLTSKEQLENSFDMQQLLKYSKICSLLDYPHGKVVLIKDQEQGGVGVSLNDQAQDSPFCFGMLLSEDEYQLAEKRALFMEKLKNNQAKYDNSLGRMSEISKQLAFIYRSYLQARNEVCCTLRFLQTKISNENYIFNDAISHYAKLLIGKNLRHTFESLEVDRLNYFKMRQYVENDRVQEFQNISSFQEFTSFLYKRRPKRGRRLVLPTACSVCLSDYHQQNNPLKACSSCGLRCHQLCYSFQRNRCGSCTYQKLQRQVKEEISWCFICRKSGLMTVKISDCLYAHGFCLLIHGFWRYGDIGAASKAGSELIEQQSSSSCPKQTCNSSLCQIEFCNPFQINGMITKNSSSQNRIINEADSLEPQYCLKEDLHSQMDRIGPSQELNLKKPKISFQIENEQNKLSKECCKTCQMPFFNNCFLICQSCGRQYHALCAFLQGFKMSIEEGEYNGSEQSWPKVICCDGQCSRIGCNRRYKLNYNRCAFTMLPADVQDNPSPPLWQH